MNVGLAFEIVSSYGIAIAEYLEPTRLNINGWIGLSWVAVWTLLFTVVIPTRPRKALLVTLASVSSVPVVIGFMIVTRRTTFQPNFAMFFFWIVFPYLLTTIMAYVGARVVYTPRQGRHRSARARQLPAGGTPWRRGYGRGLARATPAARPSGGHQAHPHLRVGRCRRFGRCHSTLRARGAGDCGSLVAAYRSAVRLRRGRRRELLLRDGAAGRPGFGDARSTARSAAGRTRDLSDAAGMPLAVRSRGTRVGTSRHQAGQPLRVPVRRRIRLREGARFRNCQGHPSHDGDGSPERSRETTCSTAPRPTSRRSKRWAERRSTAVRTFMPSDASCTFCSRDSSCSPATRPWRSSCTMRYTAPTPPSVRSELPISAALDRARPRLPCQTSLRPAAVGEGALSTARGSRRRPAVDR